MNYKNLFLEKNMFYYQFFTMQNLLITGVSSWIWKYLTEQLKSDFNITWISRTDPKLSWIDFISCDLIKSKDISNLISYIRSNKLIFDAIIFNAWVGYFDEFKKVKDREYLDMLHLNLYSNIILTKKMFPFLSPKSKLIYIWSVAAKKFMKYWAWYQASKFGLRWFVWALRNELKQKVFLLNPQYVDTNFFTQMRIEPEWRYKETLISDIYEIIKKILNNSESRFEIDL